MAGESSLGVDETLVAFITVFFHWLSSLIMLFVEKKSLKVLAWAWQTLILFVLFWILWIAVYIVSFILVAITRSSFFFFIFYGWSGLVSLIWIISLILTLIKEEFVPYPIIGPFALKKAQASIGQQ